MLKIDLKMKLNLIRSVILSLLCLTLSSSPVLSQEHPAFWTDIQAIKQYDLIYEPPQAPILFVGSSSIRLWVDFNKTFKDYTVLNRGIGGAVTADITRYLEDIVFPYKPRQIVLYVGENDLLNASHAGEIFQSFQTLYAQIRSRLPEVPLLYIAIKGSPSRLKQFNKAKEANLLINNFLKSERHNTFVDVFQPMLNEKGQMRPELFKEDQLHMNAAGYEIWNQLVLPNLLPD